jgi:hypothetical protein
MTMAKPFDLSAVWEHDDFRVQKTNLSPDAVLPAESLGQGVIYTPRIRSIRQTFAGAPTRRTILDRPGQGLMYLWNPTDVAGIVNVGKRPVDLFHVEVTYGEELTASLFESKETIAEATLYLLNRKWPESFKSSVRADLNAIGALALPFATSSIPSMEDIARANRAKEDLEIKLSWLGKAARVRGFSFEGLLSAGIRGVQGAAFGGGGGLGAGGGGRGGGGGGPEGGDNPFDPTVEVTANTKDSDGKNAIDGCTVFYNTYALGKSESKADEFPCLSTPTKCKISVGKYWMWARKKSAVGEKRPIIVGKPFSPSMTVDLQLPLP